MQNVIPKENTDFFWDSIFPKAIPSKVVFGMISQKAANGDYTANRFNLQHFNLQSITLKVNGVDVYGSPMNLYFGTNRNYTSTYVKTV